MSEEKANQREAAYKEQIKNWSAKLKQAEARAEYAERSVEKLQKEVWLLFVLTIFNIWFVCWLIFLSKVDRLEDDLVSEQEKYKSISDELEMAFAEMSGY